MKQQKKTQKKIGQFAYTTNNNNNNKKGSWAPLELGVQWRIGKRFAARVDVPLSIQCHQHRQRDGEEDGQSREKGVLEQQGIEFKVKCAVLPSIFSLSGIDEAASQWESPSTNSTACNPLTFSLFSPHFGSLALINKVHFKYINIYYKLVNFISNSRGLQKDQQNCF